MHRIIACACTTAPTVSKQYEQNFVIVYGAISLYIGEGIFFLFQIIGAKAMTSAQKYEYLVSATFWFFLIMPSFCVLYMNRHPMY